MKSLKLEIARENLTQLFSTPDLPAGATKSAANYLRNRGYIREDWDEIKVEIMIDLLIQKFSQPELQLYLKNTGDAYLVEGNSWGDTFWGECDGRGRNVLGRLLMILRGIDEEVICDEARSSRQRVLKA